MNPDLKILGQLLAVLRAGLTLHQAEQVAGVDGLSQTGAQSYAYLRAMTLASGGPPALAIARVRSVIDQQQTQLRAVELANASPRATVKLVIWLPIAALIIGQFTGLGSLSILLRSPIAIASVLVGAILLVLGNFWSNRLLRQARLIEFDRAIYLDAVSIALGGGLPIEQAEQIARKDFASPVEIEDVKALSISTGASLVQLLIEKADAIRADLNYKKSKQLERLSVKLMIPLGVSVLPAFALIAVVPMALSFLVGSNER